MRRIHAPAVVEATSGFAAFQVGLLGLSLLGSELIGLPPACWVGVTGAWFIRWQWMLSRHRCGQAGALEAQRAMAPIEHGNFDGRSRSSSK